MDWSKAKTILIIALLLTNIIIGGTYLGEKEKEDAALKAAAENAVAYAKEQGVSVECQLPSEKKRMPVLFVSLDWNGTAADCEYRGIPVEAGEGFSGAIHPENQGDAKGELISAASALFELINELGKDAEGLEIKEIEIVYWLDLSMGDETAAQDTAVPAWKFVCASGSYYIEAFGQ